MEIRQFVSFWLGQDLFGIDILYVREINRNLDIAPVDRAPKYVRGLLNLRGQIVTVIDLGLRLRLPAREVSPGTGCIVLKTAQDLAQAKGASSSDTLSNDLAGLLVDKVGDVITVDADQVELPPARASGVSGHFLEGVIKLKNCLLVTLKITEILLVED